MIVIEGLREGLRAARRSWGLVFVLWGVNFCLAASLAGPLASALGRDLAHRDAGTRMMYGFDYAWWSRFADSQSGFTRTFSPEILGTGFAVKNINLLLKGAIPWGSFTRGEGGPEASLDGVIVALLVLHLLVQTFLAGGLLGVLRSAQGSWTVRGLLHGSGFYFGRISRVAVIALGVDLLLFRLNVPIARIVDHRAGESVSEATAMALVLGRHAALLLALLLVHLTSCYAKVILVLEERSSAVLAFLSSLGFLIAHPLRTLGHYASVGALGLGLLVIWNALDQRWETTGYKSLVVTLLLGQGLVAGRMGLRLALLSGQIAIYRRLTARE